MQLVEILYILFVHVYIYMNQLITIILCFPAFDILLIDLFFRLKTWMRSRMDEERLTGLALLNTHRDMMWKKSLTDLRLVKKGPLYNYCSEREAVIRRPGSYRQMRCCSMQAARHLCPVPFDLPSDSPRYLPTDRSQLFLLPLPSLFLCIFLNTHRHHYQYRPPTITLSR